MKIARVKYDNSIFYGEIIEDTIKRYEGSPFVVWEDTEEVYQLDEVQVLAPVLPSKVIGVAKNYAKHAEEMGLNEYEAPDSPEFFIKPSTSVIGPGENIIYPKIGKHVDHEAELAVVIGKICHGINKDDWQGYVLGFTAGNDLSERVLQGSKGMFTRAKGFDTFCPLGPFIETEIDKNPELSIKAFVNGELRQDGNTRDMIFSIGELIEFISGIMTLLPGDVILTGTPDGVGPVVPGDEVHVKIDTIGDLINPVL
jgi:2-keto-4-pentenoate hydratase/2-oxohepta-3-ene-1,7-dioic acid hydratase in catechol pathway